MKLLLIAGLLFITSAAQAAAWSAFGDGTKQACDLHLPCRVSLDGNVYVLRANISHDDGVQNFSSLEIENVASKTRETFELPEMNQHFASELYEIYEVRPRESGEHFQIAIHAFDAAQQGPMFYRLEFDPASKSFTLNDEPLPRADLLDGVTGLASGRLSLRASAR